MSNPHQNTTFIVKTFMRPNCLNRLIDSIFEYCGNVKILVADDSVETFRRSDVEVFALPFDTGISYGRNFLVDQIETEFMVLMDDDHVFTERTAINKLILPIKEGLFDLVGAKILENGKNFCWQGILKTHGSILTLSPGINGIRNGIMCVDFCHNAFAARTAVIRNVRWDDQLKLGKHTDFFLRAKANGVRVGVCPDVEFQHKPERIGAYRAFRQREPSFRLEMMKKHGLSEIVNRLSPKGSLKIPAV